MHWQERLEPDYVEAGILSDWSGKHACLSLVDLELEILVKKKKNWKACSQRMRTVQGIRSNSV